MRLACGWCRSNDERRAHMTQPKPFYRKVGGLHFLAFGSLRLSFCRSRSTTAAASFESIRQPVAASILALVVAFGGGIGATLAQPEDRTEAAIVDHAEGCFNDHLLGTWEDVRPCLDEIGQGAFVDWAQQPGINVADDCGTDAECLALTVEAFCEWRAARMGW